ncbi:hypothetical protein T440DRAFT_177286 [Plenodomus tracheiphilus IPT5]|uniref:Uncharacterized protein n=1 Tax=Plenodomus tracheiphilus IPT5 TaxID=1408161 RepID=A0A6A7AXV3_9PLEO|nr:hypothetical protein T440DRAFT_177286 [Plenodomus tracheiphilus IPT5]
MSRPLTLLIYNSPLFPAHWALWLPSLSNPNIGKLPNAVGSASQGFEVVIEREHDVSGITQRYQIVPLGLVSEDCVCDGDAEGGGGGAGSRDKGVCDVERVALGVCAPGVSLRGDGDEGLEVCVRCYVGILVVNLCGWCW